MFGWIVLYITVVVVVRKFLGWIHDDQHQDLHATVYRDPSFESHASNINTSSSVQNTRRNDNRDAVCQRDGPPIYYYEWYAILSTKKSQLQSENGKNYMSTEVPDQSKPILCQSSLVSFDQPRSSSVKAMPPATESQSPSSFNNRPSSKPTLYHLQSDYGNNKAMKEAKPTPSLDQSTRFLFQSSSLTYDQPRSLSAKAKPPAKESQSASSFNNPPIYYKPILSRVPFNSMNQPTKTNYVWVVQNETLPIYMIPKDIENMIKKGIVPCVLKKPLSPATYKDYFGTLLYAEEFYIEKSTNFQLLNVTLELHEAAIYKRSPTKKNLNKSAEKVDKTFVAFEINSAPEEQAFLLSRDFVFARKSGTQAKKFQGIVYRVMKSNQMLVEFEEEFYSQHRQNRQYDISFSFNRVCLRRAHQAISAAASGALFKYLFPKRAIRKNICSPSLAHCVSNYKLDSDSNSAVRQILSFKGYPPYLVEGPLCVSSTKKQKLSKTGLVVRESVLQIYQRSSSNCRILICSPINSTCDILLTSLKKHKIPESVMFLANAAFREIDKVPVDILPSCFYDGDCFSFPPPEELKQFRIIFSTFISSFRLLNEGITAGHFSHIFLVDASSATEPETMIPLGNLANKNTTVILTGAPNNKPSCIHSDIARKNGLGMSYFERLCATKIYKSSNPTFIMRL